MAATAAAVAGDVPSSGIRGRRGRCYGGHGDPPGPVDAGPVAGGHPGPADGGQCGGELGGGRRDRGLGRADRGADLGRRRGGRVRRVRGARRGGRVAGVPAPGPGAGRTGRGCSPGGGRTEHECAPGGRATAAAADADPADRRGGRRRCTGPAVRHLGGHRAGPPAGMGRVPERRRRGGGDPGRHARRPAGGPAHGCADPDRGAAAQRCARRPGGRLWPGRDGGLADGSRGEPRAAGCRHPVAAAAQRPG